MHRLRRIALIVIGGSSLLAGLLWIGLHYYVKSSYARTLAGERLSNAIGMPVQVEEFGVDSSQTSMKLRIVDPANPAREVLAVRTLTADVSMMELVSGTANPKEVTLGGAALTLTLDRSGRPTLKIPATPTVSPGSTPTIRLTDATLNVQQEGRPPFVLKHITLTAEHRDGRYRLNGKITDESWGDWTIRGDFEVGARTGYVEFVNSNAPLEAELLRSIPLVPEATWAHVQTAGHAPATIRVEAGANVKYEVTLSPSGGGDVTVHDIDATLKQVTGTIRIHDAAVSLEKCNAVLEGGNVAVDGTLDFAPEPSKLALRVGVTGVDVTKLPGSWGLPDKLTGTLRGQADLELLIAVDGRIEPRGGGKCTIENATIAGLPAEVKLRLRSDGKRYRFESPAAPPLEEKIVFFQAPAAPAPESSLDASITLRDVEIAEVLKQFEVKIPYSITGRVTVNVIATVPVGSAADRKSYKFRGTLTSPLMKFEGFEVKDMRAVMIYRDGVLSLQELNAAFPSGTTTGRVKGTATVQVEPRGDAQATLDLTDFPLKEFAKALPALKIALDGPLSGRAEFRAPLNELKDPATWTGQASLNAKSLTIGTSIVEEFQAKTSLDAGVLKLTELNVKGFRGKLSGIAEVPLISSKAGKLALEFKDLDSAGVTKLIPEFPVPLTGRVTGKLTATSSTSEANAARKVTAELDLSASKMTVRGVPAEHLDGKITVAKGQAEYALEGRSLGGTFEIKGHYPAATTKDEQGYFRLRNLDLNRLHAVVDAPFMKPLSGILNLNFEYSSDFSRGDGRANIRNLSWGRETLASELTGNLELTNGVLDLRDFTGSLAGGRLRARARYDLKDSRRNFYSIVLDRASAKRFAAVLPVALDVQDSEITLTARGRIGAQASGQFTLALASTTLAGIPLSNIELPITWTGDVSSGRISISNGVARLDHGKIDINAALDYGAISRLTGSLQFTDISLRKVLGTGSSFVGNGKISGRFTFGDTALRSVDDIAGTLNATLNQTSVREVPLLKVITPYLSVTGLLQPFEAGEIKGRLANGIFRLERFALSNPGAQIFAEGSITTKGRVDLDVVAVTGQVGPNVRALKLLGIQIPALGPVPISLIQRVSDVLSNRMIRLTITGTSAAPVVQINKAALLTDTAVRFFLGQYILPENLSGAR